MGKTINRDRLMDSKGLAETVRVLRARKGLTQEEVAAMIVSERTGQPISKQLVSRAENEKVGSAANNLRVQIIEVLSGQRVRGPFWVLEDG